MEDGGLQVSTKKYIYVDSYYCIISLTSAHCLLTEPDKVWSTSMGYINMFRHGICSSWEDFPGTKDAGLWIHHFVILYLIHPFFMPSSMTIMLR